jgi:hypothetical protein
MTQMLGVFVDYLSKEIIPGFTKRYLMQHSPSNPSEEKQQLRPIQQELILSNWLRCEATE